MHYACNKQNMAKDLVGVMASLLDFAREGTSVSIAHSDKCCVVLVNVL